MYPLMFAKAHKYKNMHIKKKGQVLTPPQTLD